MLTVLWCALYLVGCAMAYVWWMMAKVTQLMHQNSDAVPTNYRVWVHFGAYAMMAISWPFYVARYVYYEVFGPADED